jgi:hypothetical protein
MNNGRLAEGMNNRSLCSLETREQEASKELESLGINHGGFNFLLKKLKQRQAEKTS